MAGSEAEDAKPEVAAPTRQPKRRRRGMMGFMPGGDGVQTLVSFVGLAVILYMKGFHHVAMAHFRKLMGWRVQSPEELARVESLMKDVRAGKSIDLMDFSLQLHHFCGKGAASGACKDYLSEAVEVAKAVKSGPGTWDRKPLKKAAAKELDKLLFDVASRSEAKSALESLKGLAKEFVDNCPKSIKADLSAPWRLEHLDGEDADEEL